MPPSDKHEYEEISPFRRTSSYYGGDRRLIAPALVFVAACVGTVLYMGSQTTSGPAPAMMMRDSGVGSSNKDGARSCTLDECFASSCNFDVAPYTCLFHNGGVHGGCSPIEWTPESCTEQCNLSGCDEMEIPEGSETCEGQKCSEEWCSSGQVCGDDVSFQCTNGAARFGCSADPLQWTLRSSASTCSICCDTTTCE